jgi:hypothetical protein
MIRGKGYDDAALAIFLGNSPKPRFGRTIQRAPTLVSPHPPGAIRRAPAAVVMRSLGGAAMLIVQCGRLPRDEALRRARIALTEKE